LFGRKVIHMCKVRGCFFCAGLVLLTLSGPALWADAITFNGADFYNIPTVSFGDSVANYARIDGFGQQTHVSAGNTSGSGGYGNYVDTTFNDAHYYSGGGPTVVVYGSAADGYSSQDYELYSTHYSSSFENEAWNYTAGTDPLNRAMDVNTYGYIYFTANQSENYSLGGDYSFRDGSGSLDVAISDLTDNGTSIYESYNRTNQTTRTFYVGGTNGAQTYTGGTQGIYGTLVAGHSYQFEYVAHLFEDPSYYGPWGPDAYGSGGVSLYFSDPAVDPTVGSAAAPLPSVAWCAGGLIAVLCVVKLCRGLRRRTPIVTIA
jgi:hypothetical protein